MGFMNKFMNFIGVEDEDELEEEQYEQPQRQSMGYEQPQRPIRTINNAQSRQAQTVQYPQNTASTQKKGGRVVAHPSYEQPVKHQTNIYQINEHTETRSVIDDLLAGRSVLLNLENLDAVESQRVIDTLSGAAYAIDATLKKAAHQTYYIAPNNVEIAGNFNADDGRKSASTIFRSAGE